MPRRPGGADNLQGFTTNISYDHGADGQFKITRSDVGYPDGHLPDGLVQGDGRAG